MHGIKWQVGGQMVHELTFVRCNASASNLNNNNHPVNNRQFTHAFSSLRPAAIYKNRKTKRAYAASQSSSSSPTALPISFEEVQSIATSRGLTITVSTLGPGYRILCRDGGLDGPILAVTSGFIIPFLGIMHCDMLQIFTKGKKGEEGERTRVGTLGLGLLIGGATFSFGMAQGCTKAEILAINDDDAWHQRLVRYYSRFGFKPVHIVTGGRLLDLPHMLVWGGVGTRMDADMREMLERWAPAMKNSKLDTDE